MVSQIQKSNHLSMSFIYFFLSATFLIFIYLCPFAFALDNISASGKVFPGKGGRVDTFSPHNELKSPQSIDTAPVIKLNDGIQQSLHADLNKKQPRQRIGFARVIEPLADWRSFKQKLHWQKTGNDGHTATILISSPRAKAVKAGIVVNKLPQEAEFRFFNADYPATHLSLLITGEQINHLLQLNKTADLDHPDAFTYWSPTVHGDHIGIEIHLPPGILPGHLDISIPFLSHIQMSPFASDNDFSQSQLYGDSADCQIDATCYDSLLSIRNATAKISFTESGNTYICTGTLLNDTDESSHRPYFITANHCIGSQTVASTLETHWFYESDRCNSTTQNPDYTTKFGGATLLWTKEMTTSSRDDNQDISFLELHHTPPAGVSYAGWSTAFETSTATGIHHPSGDWKKVSMGLQEGSYACYYTYGNDYNCSPSSNGNFVNIIWTDGGTEDGSSGSGLFNDQDQLIGTLLGGWGECEGSESDYSKFGAAFNAGNLSQWLNPSATCTYSIVPSSGNFSTGGGTGSVTVTASSPDCTWTTSENLSWVSVFPATGTGSLPITISVTANTGPARSGYINIAGHSYTVNQAAFSAKSFTVLVDQSPNHTVSAGSDILIFGSSDTNRITLESGAKAELINFPGQNLIEIHAASDRFQVSRSGTIVTFEGTDGTVLKIPTSVSLQSISFSDKTMALRILADRVMLDNQEILTKKMKVPYRQP